ncbi:MAG: hypothetical protein K0R38_3022 [Polyangiaceae bacterium]|jgi:hypothetical protein|nr:hypothetical protein [Polyangiaceae bacterium]
MLGLATHAALCSSCFFFYDSRWGESKASQKRVAKERMPSQLVGSGAHVPAPQSKVERFRIRAYATPRYAAALVDGEAQFTQTLNAANPTFAHDLAMQLELESYRVWSGTVLDDDLKALLDAIEKVDPAQDVDWVVVLASPLRMVALSPDQLGVGKMLGRHLAIRAMSDPEELEAIQQSFDELSENEQEKLYAARKRHKSATVLLHEVGHTLGMPHELDLRSMMSAKYDHKSSAFSPHSARIGRRALELRASPLGSELHRSAARAALNVLENAPAHTFEVGTASQSQALFRYHAEAGPTSRPVAATPATAATPGTAVAPSTASQSLRAAPLAANDAALLERARAEHAAGRHREARSLAVSLFERYPGVLVVQELRCQLATKVGLTMAEESAECAPLLRLSGAPF